MRGLCLAAFCFTLLSACCDSAFAESDTHPYACSGSHMPRINLFVRDSLNDSLIDTASVTLHIEDDESTVLLAMYVSEQESNADALSNAYFSYFETDADLFLYDVQVDAPGFHTHVKRNIPFTVSTACDAINAVTATIHLCPVDTDCL